MNNKSLYNQFFISAAIELPKDLDFIRSTWCGPGVSSKSFKPNHDPQTENNFLFFNFINNAQATSDRVQAKNSQAKRGALINFFYS
jgi:hypothetical protein